MLLKAASLAFALLLSACTQQEFNASHLDPYSVLPGKWGWQGSDDCAVSPETFRFSADRKRFFAAHSLIKDDGSREARREVGYEVHARVPHGLSMTMDNEKRTDQSGKPVIWELVVVDQDQVCWHREDWPAGGCTKSILRCKI